LKRVGIRMAGVQIKDERSAPHAGRALVIRAPEGLLQAMHRVAVSHTVNACADASKGYMEG